MTLMSHVYVHLLAGTRFRLDSTDAVVTNSVANGSLDINEY
jgi:hypothetical protein